MADRLDDLLADIDNLEADDDDYPWTDAASWSADGSHQDPETDDPPMWDIPGRVITLSARLGDGRTARWSMLSGWSGDEGVVRAAQCVADLYGHMGEVCAAARGLIGVSVDGVVDEACWVAARL